MVVSMKPIKAVDVAKEVEVTSQFPQAHDALLRLLEFRTLRNRILVMLWKLGRMNYQFSMLVV